MNVKKTVFWLVIAALVIGGGYLLMLRLMTTDDDRVREVIQTLIDNLESSRTMFAVANIREKMSKDYRHRGEAVDVVIGRDEAIAYIRHLKETFTGFKVEIREMKAMVSGATARVEVTGRVTAASAESPGARIEVMTDGGHNRAIIDLAKEDGAWLVTGSERQRHELRAP